MELRKIGYDNVHWIHMAQERDLWCDFGSMAMNTERHKLEAIS
jgi:hypothetical protein